MIIGFAVIGMLASVLDPAHTLLLRSVEELPNESDDRCRRLVLPNENGTTHRCSEARHPGIAHSGRSERPDETLFDLDVHGNTSRRRFRVQPVVPGGVPQRQVWARPIRHRTALEQGIPHRTTM